MTTTDPSPVTGTPAERPNVDEMFVVHRVFRRELPAASELVRRVTVGDRRRAELVAGHVELLVAGLHMHHVGEDEVLWPRLLERASPSTGLVEMMQEQHQLVDQHTERVAALLTDWRRGAGAAEGRRLADALDLLSSTLLEHLDLEEREVVPLIAQHITAAEWNTLGEHGRDEMSFRQAPLMFGSLLEEADQRERAMMLDPLPAPLRWYLTTFGARRYERYISELRGR